MGSTNQGPIEAEQPTKTCAGVTRWARFARSSAGRRTASSVRPHTPKTRAGRPMNVRKVDDEGNLWFLNAGDCPRRTWNWRPTRADEAVLPGVLRTPISSTAEAAAATVSTDRGENRGVVGAAHQDVVHEAAWTTPVSRSSRSRRATAITGTTKHGNAAAFVKVLVGSVVGKTMDDSIEGKLRGVTPLSQAGSEELFGPPVYARRFLEGDSTRETSQPAARATISHPKRLGHSNRLPRFH